MRDRGVVSMDRLSETICCESNGHVTPKGQGRDPKIFETPYLRNLARYTYGYNWPPIGNRILRVKWSPDWWRHVITKGQNHSSYGPAMGQIPRSTERISSFKHKSSRSSILVKHYICLTSFSLQNGVLLISVHFQVSCIPFGIIILRLFSSVLTF